MSADPSHQSSRLVDVNTGMGGEEYEEEERTEE